MKNTVVFRDNQELDADDLNNIEIYARSSFDTLTSDAINTAPAYAGFTISTASATSLALTAGRYYDSTGAVWELVTPQTINLFSLLPLVTQKWVAIVVNGSDVQTNVQPRDFLINATTGQTQPQSVAMEEQRLAVINTIAGVEAPQPSYPPTPTTVTVIGYVLLSTTGVQQVIQFEPTQLPNLQAVEGQVETLQTWQTQVGAQITSLGTALAALAAQAKGLASEVDLQALANAVSQNTNAITSLAATVASLALQVSHTPTVYLTEVINFVDYTNCDYTNGSFTAVINEGIFFPGSASSTGTFALLNSLDINAAVNANFLLPTFKVVPRIQCQGYSSQLQLSTFSFLSSVSYTQLTQRRRRYRCGRRFAPTPATPFALANPYDPLFTNFAFNSESFTTTTNASRAIAANPAIAATTLGAWKPTRLNAFWADDYTAPYWNRVTSSYTATGQHIAQTFVNAQNGYLAQLGLFFTQAALTGDVKISICQVTSHGLPDCGNALQTVTLTAANIKVGSLSSGAGLPTLVETQVQIPPTFLQAGQTYAIVIGTPGAHFLAMTQTDWPTLQGSYFYADSTGAFNVDLTQQIRCNIYYAQWAQTRYEIQLQPLSLSGGIEDIDILHHAQIPGACSLEFHVQQSGVWYPLAVSGVGPNLSGLPTLLPLKAVFTGTTDLMPGFGLSTLSQVQLLGTLGSSYTFLTTTQTPSTASQNFKVSAILKNWNSGIHTATIRVKDSGGTLHTGTVVDTVLVDGTTQRVVTYALGSTTATFVVQIDGATSSSGTVFQVSQLTIDAH
jgi:hypothetical protein